MTGHSKTSSRLRCIVNRTEKQSIERKVTAAFEQHTPGLLCLAYFLCHIIVNNVFHSTNQSPPSTVMLFTSIWNCMRRWPNSCSCVVKRWNGSVLTPAAAKQPCDCSSAACAVSWHQLTTVRTHGLDPRSSSWREQRLNTRHSHRKRLAHPTHGSLASSRNAYAH